jgi:hypothetical protein
MAGIFELKITLGNAEMRSLDAIAEALKVVAMQLEQLDGFDSYSSGILDANGQMVGAWNYTLPVHDDSESE